jgi:hypothetical protein
LVDGLDGSLRRDSMASNVALDDVSVSLGFVDRSILFDASRRFGWFAIIKSPANIFD